MKRFCFLITFLFFLSIYNIIAQDDYIIKQYLFHQQVFNPAAIGQNGKMGLFLYGNNNFDKNIITNSYLISAYNSIENKNIGIGVSFIQDRYGKKKAYFLGDIVYYIKLKKENKLKFGLKSGLFNYKNLLTEYELYPDGLYDPVFVNDINEYYFLIGLGLFYSSKNFQAGISSPQINVIKRNNKEPKIILFSSYNVVINNKITIQPNVLINFRKNSKNNVNTALSCKFDEKLWIGVAQNFKNLTNIYTKFALKNGIGFGYLYDFNRKNSFSKYFNTHSLSISYDLKN